MNGWIDATGNECLTIEALLHAKALQVGIVCSRWADPIPHPTDVDRFAYRIETAVYSALPPPFRNNVKTDAQMKALGFFPLRFAGSPETVALAERVEIADHTKYILDGNHKPVRDSRFANWKTWAAIGAAAAAGAALYGYLS